MANRKKEFAEGELQSMQEPLEGSYAVEKTQMSIPEAIHFTFPEMPYNTAMNYRYRNVKSRYEVNTMKSETVPDQSLTVQELIYRFTHGKASEGVGVYDTDVDFEMPANWKSLDLSEKMDWLADKRDEYAEITERLEKERDLLVQREREAEIEKRVNEKLAANQAAKERERVQSVLWPEGSKE